MSWHAVMRTPAEMVSVENRLSKTSLVSRVESRSQSLLENNRKSKMEVLQKMLPAMVLFGVAIVVWWVLSIRGRKFSSTAEFESELQDGRIKVLEFFSNG